MDHVSRDGVHKTTLVWALWLNSGGSGTQVLKKDED